MDVDKLICAERIKTKWSQQQNPVNWQLTTDNSNHQYYPDIFLWFSINQQLKTIYSKYNKINCLTRLVIPVRRQSSKS